MAKSNVIDFSKFNDLENKEKKKIIRVDPEDQKLSAKELARREKVEAEIVRINKRYLKLAKSMRDSKSDAQRNTKVLKYCFNMSTRLLPVAEEIYLRYRSERGMYALNALVNQTREIAADIRQLSSNDKTIEYLLNVIFLPTLQLTLQHQIGNYAELKSLITQNMPVKKAKLVKLKMNRMMKNNGKLLDDISKSVEEKIRTYFK